MRPITAKKIIKILEDNDFVLSRQKGSHKIFVHSLSGITVPVPIHGKNKPIHIGTLFALIKQSKIPKNKFK
ncbi:MAG: type II toxin-antitoxin system HicA family toxin [Candidatus Pacebacteria bacterium]|nr:type II toxin-antitoxin system HicA family toxin [Candidatus Paceibacterota bacterium]